MPISQDSFSNSMGQHRDHTEEIFLLEPINFLKQFCRQPPANPLQFSIPRAILAPCGKTVKNKNKTKSAYWENRPILRSDSIEMMNLPQEVSAEALQQFQDLELTRRSQEGDTEAFGELVTKYRTKIFTMVYGIVRNEHDARDIVQEGFLKAWQSIQRFEGRSSFYTWLYSLMMNAAKPRRADRFLERMRRQDERPLRWRTLRSSSDVYRSSRCRLYGLHCNPGLREERLPRED
jgi:Sigma-70 region 2